MISPLRQDTIPDTPEKFSLRVTHDRLEPPTLSVWQVTVPVELMVRIDEPLGQLPDTRC